MLVVRGDIFRYKPREYHGHKQFGPRFGVVVQSDDLLLSTWLVAPTSTSARPAVFRPEIMLDGRSTRILVEQTTVVNPEQELGDFVGRLDGPEFAELDAAIALVFGLIV